MNKRIRVLVVDDQEIIRKMIKRGLSVSPEIEVIALAQDAFDARDKIVEFQPDVMTLDVEMPKMNGLEFLKKLMPQYPIPVIMVSSLTREGQSITLEALDAGAVDFVTKPDGTDDSFEKMIQKLIEKIIIASKVDTKSLLRKKRFGQAEKRGLQVDNRKVSSLIAIGASTGGTTAIKEILTSLPENMPPIVIVQHMPFTFTRLFAERLNSLCALNVKEADSGEKLTSGGVYIAPGDRHLRICENRNSLLLSIENTEKVCGHRPSVDVLFNSVSETSICKDSIGVILTGMGKDGAAGMKKMFQRGAITIGQDEASSVVYGMPREAFVLGGISRQVALDDIAEVLVNSVNEIQHRHAKQKSSPVSD
ncbi:MAG: chemotaxis response regulator protein-glutamate methylesterase [Leptospiraceae bacterium]|nr:chemotaxis response regulator protein-glutamate methylesterase [Leptospiraceae bacterium]